MNQQEPINHLADKMQDVAREFHSEIPEQDVQQATGFVNGAIQKAKDMSQSVTSADVQQLVQTMKDNAKSAATRGGDVVTKYPLYTVLGAAAVGALVGTLISRSVRD